MEIRMKTTYNFTHKTADAEYIVEIMWTKDGLESWLYAENCGIKMFLFGVPEEQDGQKMTIEEFADMVEGNLSYDMSSYIDEYNEEYNF